MIDEGWLRQRRVDVCDVLRDRLALPVLLPMPPPPSPHSHPSTITFLRKESALALSVSAPPVVMIPMQWITQTKNSSWESSYLPLQACMARTTFLAIAQVTGIVIVKAKAKARACLPASYFFSLTASITDICCQSHNFRVRVGGPYKTCSAAESHRNEV